MSALPFTREFSCPSCGAPIKQALPGSRSLSCSYCGQTSHINADSLQAVGEQNLLIDYGSALGVGKQGRYRDRDFSVLGRIRIDYSDGFWDEWYLQFLDDGSTAWLQEDDGSFVLFDRVESYQKPLPFDKVPVGTFLNLNVPGEKVFTTSKSRASVNGGEGELPFRIIPGETADFIDGIQQGTIISLEVLPDVQQVFWGQPVNLEELDLI